MTLVTGFDLPQTGGTGNWLFPVVGLTMLTFCVIGLALITRKKSSAEND